MNNYEKLFLIGIGGSGARVIKALTFLLASGAKANASTIVPIIIDPHKTNSDLIKVKENLKQYRFIQSKAEQTAGNFFSTKIMSLGSLKRSVDDNTGKEKIMDDFTFDLSMLTNEKFRDYIGFNSFDNSSDKAFARLLFSEQNLNTNMDIGFVSNPNIGSVVLNMFVNSKEYQFLADNFGKNDAIFIISSIFGGTGAAGFPIVIKNIRNSLNAKDLNNIGFLSEANIGALSILPYFGVESEEGARINDSSFISKTKSALYYYEKNLEGEKSQNVLYYLGDEIKNKYTYDEGDDNQKDNLAHFIELIGATAVLDFLDIPPSDLDEPLYKEFYAREKVDEMNFSHLSPDTNRMIKEPLSKYFLFLKYMQNIKEISNNQNWAKIDSPTIDDVLNSRFFQELKNFNSGYLNWLKEIANNSRAFNPFVLDINKDVILNFINNESPRKLNIIEKIKGDHLAYFNGILNKISSKSTFKSPESKIIELFSLATKEVFKNRFIND